MLDEDDSLIKAEYQNKKINKKYKHQIFTITLNTCVHKNIIKRYLNICVHKGGKYKT